MFGDPAVVYEQIEARGSKGCIHERTARLMRTTHTVCTKLLPGGKRRQHGRRCQSCNDGEK